MPSYVSPYRGRGGSSLPPGYLQMAGNQGAQIGAGIESGLGSVATALEQRAEKLDKKSKGQKAAKALVQFLGNDFPMDPKEFDMLSADDQIAAAQGIVGAQAYKKGQEDLLQSQDNRKYMGVQADRMKVINKVDDAKLNEALLQQDNRKRFSRAVGDRMTLPNGAAGPVIPPSEEELIGMAAQNDILMDPQLDNLLTGIGRAQGRRTGFGTPGTITPVPGTRKAFGWQSANSGSFLDMGGTPGEADPPPAGYKVWDSGNGKPKLVPERMAPLTPMEQARVDSLPQDQNLLSQLMSLKENGTSRVNVDPNGVANPAMFNSWPAGSNIDEKIRETQARIAQKQAILNRVRPTVAPAGQDVEVATPMSPAAQPAAPSKAPAPAKGSFEEFQQWRRGNGK